MGKFLIIAKNIGKIKDYTEFLSSGGIDFEVKIVGEKFDEGDYSGLILVGGEDVNPKRYGERNAYPGKNKIDDSRDEYEFEAIDKFFSSDKVIFGICRGVQVINVFFGGTLYQDIPSDLGSFIHRYYKGKSPNNFCVIREDIYHSVRVVERNPIFDKGDVFYVASYHHQAIKEVASSFLVFAVSEQDKIVEGIFHREKVVFGVQWHPERNLLYGDEVARESSRKILNFLKISTK
ncbi:Putative glutamine amidotransferase [bacterium HR19]|nr:Putative glutamine amidotransferase [bacterium HR19]